MEEGLPTFVLFSEQKYAKRLVFMEKICIKACPEIEITQVVCCGHPKNIHFMLNSSRNFHCASSPIANSKIKLFIFVFLFLPHENLLGNGSF